MNVVKNFFWNAGYQLFILIVPLITIPYISRVLGPTGVGVNSYTNSVVQYFILLGSLGINTYGNREVAYCRDSREKLSKVFWEISLLRFICIGIATVFYIIFVELTDQYRFIYILQGITLVGTAFDISWFFMGIENFRITVIRNAIVKIASVFLIFSLVKESNDVGTYVLILSLSQFFGFLTLWPYMHRYVDIIPPRMLNIASHLKPAITLLIPQIATQVYLQLNKTMLGVFRGVESSGFYDNSDKIVKMVLAIITALGTVLLPRVAHSFANGDEAGVKRFLTISMHVVLVLAWPMMFGLAAIADPLTILFFGPKFKVVGLLMSVESIIIVLIGISNVVGTQYLLPTNQLHAYTTSVIIGSVVNIVLNVPFILLWGTLGAVIATVLSEGAVSLYGPLSIK